ncbi:hypothetical protein KKH39_03575 [Patescibacteria group bacterium]|nr:hypothetical protein [Patescibacteria group bacterium]
MSREKQIKISNPVRGLAIDGTKQVKIKKYFILLLILPVFLSGCILSVNQKKPASTETSGGLFRSSDQAKTWEKVTTLYTTGGQKATFDAASITVMAFDHLDDSAIYLGTQHDGIFYSYNYGDGWFNTLSGIGTINDIVVDQAQNCTIYAAAHNKIYKTTDCSRTWNRMFFETRKGQYITAVNISPRDNQIIYAGNSSGDFLRSNDGGLTWDVLDRFGARITDIFVLEKEDSPIVYAVVQDKGIYKSEDEAEIWTNLMDLRVDRAEIDEDEAFITIIEDEEKKMGRKLTNQEKYDLEQEKKYLSLYKIKGATSIVTASIDRSIEDGIIFTSRGTIYRLTDGRIWKQIKLLTPPSSKEIIYSVLVNPKNTQEIFYGTSKALYHSLDNGSTWSIDSLPTDFTARGLAYSLDNKYLYLGAFKIEEK